jgi:hypothetical protein
MPFAQTSYDPYGGLETIPGPPAPYVAVPMANAPGLSTLQVNPLLALQSAGLNPAQPAPLFNIDWQSFVLLGLGIWAAAMILPPMFGMLKRD